MTERNVTRRTTSCALGVALALLTTACTEDLLAPGEGTCPAYCPPEQVAVVDSLLLESVVGDSAFEGYVLPFEAGGLQLLLDPGGVVPASRAVARFVAFAERLQIHAGDTATGSVLGTDSFTVRLTVQARGGSGVELGFYRLPAVVDSAAAFAALDPFFEDSALVAVAPIPDTLTAGEVTVRLDGDAFPSLDADGRIAALGVALRAPDGAFATLGTLESAASLLLTRHVQIDSAGESVPRNEGKLPQFDTYIAPDRPAVPADLLRVGGAPSSRALFRFALPARILDSATVVRATLLLVPAAPSRGAPTDTLRLIAQGVTADVGAKSPLVTIPQDSLLLRLGRLPIGSSDTLRLDVTGLVLSWAANPTAPRAVMVRAVPEGSALAEGIFASTASTAGRPALQVTFVPALTLGGR